MLAPSLRPFCIEREGEREGERERGREGERERERERERVVIVSKLIKWPKETSLREVF